MDLRADSACLQRHLPASAAIQRLDRLNKGNFDPRENNYTALRRLVTGTEIAETGLDHTTDTFKRLIGRDPRSVTQFIQDHVTLFK